MKLLDRLLIPALCFSAILLLITGGVYLTRRSENKTHTMKLEEEDDDEVFVVDLPNDTPGVPEDDSADDIEVTIPTADDSYRYLAIGNSITIHRICEFWWGEWGMAASTRENDYVHLVQSGLNERYGNASVSICSFIPWEKTNTGGDRLAVLDQLEPYLNEDLDLVSVQLGDGLTDYTGLEDDFEKLLLYIRIHAPNAQILLVGNFWANENIDDAKKQAASACNVTFVDLSPLTVGENEDIFRSYEGAPVYGDDGQWHNIIGFDVGEHPNDQAMAWIATYILDAISE